MNNFIGDCRDQDLIDEIFGSINDFAWLVEENGDNFVYERYRIEYNEDADIHSFYFN